MKSFNHKTTAFLLPFLVFLIPFSFYVYTLNPSISAADSTELVNTAIVLGVPHQPSFPINTLLSHLFSLLPFGPIPWRVNLMSAFFQAGAVVLIYQSILKLYYIACRKKKRRVTGGERFLAFASSLFLGFSLIFWQFANRMEVFPLSNFLASLLFFLGLSWWQKMVNFQPVEKDKVNPSLGWLYLFAIVAGLAFTHHQTVVMLAPAFLFLFFQAGSKYWFKKKIVFKLLICFLLGVLPYFSLILIARAEPVVRWGEPVDFKSALNALRRSDYGTFSPYAQHPSTAESLLERETPLDQLAFYFKSVNRDFTFLGLALAIIGAIALFRFRRKLFWFLFLAFFFTGPFFLGFANWTIDSGFHQAIVKRFQMLPNLCLTLFIAFGFWFFWQQLMNLKLDFKEKKNQISVFLLLGMMSLSFIYPLGRNFKKADNRDNSLTINYARHLLSGVPNNALILISGDVMTFSVDYWRTVVEPDDQRVVFSPGLLYMDWYVERIKKQHPEVIIPPPKPGYLQASTTELVKANWGKRPIYIAPELYRHDPEVGEKYVLWPKHLLFLVKPKGEDLKLEPYREENEILWQSLDLKLMEKTRKNNPLLEYAIVPEYARHFFNLGSVFESVHLYEDAIREYERALVIHPGFPDPYKNLGRVYGFELAEKDYSKAWYYFNNFLQTALPSQMADVEAVKEAMAVLQEEAVKEATQSGELKEASDSGELATPSADN